MYKYTIFFLTVLFAFTATAQRDLTPNKRRSAFGKRDLSTYKPYGLQVQIGPNYTFTRKDNPLVKSEEGAPDRYQYTQDPNGAIGVFGEIGMAHFPMKTPKILLFGKRLVSYYDWGVGIKYIGGEEITKTENLNSVGEIISTDVGSANFFNTRAYVRGAAHKNFYIGDKWFIDNGLGFNVDYRIASTVRNYFESEVYYPETQKFSGEIFAQLNFDLGIGYKVKRGLYLIPGVRAPILGIYEFNGGSPKLNWFSSTYWPVLFHAKAIILFKDRGSKNGCAPGSVEDQKRNKEFMQNR
ncbi:MAG: hypothetical protein ACI9XP_001053 [Lentimonas sp.]|jgi:hypothetical protein